MDKAFLLNFIYQTFRILPQNGCACRNRAVSRLDALDCHPRFTPAPALMMTVWHYPAAQTIQRPGEARLRRLLTFKLFPHRLHLPRHINGEKPKDTLCCSLLPLALRQHSGLVEGEGIPGINLHQVVNKQHSDNVQHIYLGRSVFREHHCHQGQLPGMLGVILRTLTMQNAVASKNRLHFICFFKKLHLL